MTAMHRWCRRLALLTVGISILAAATACSDDGDAVDAATTPAPVRDLATYDAFVLASAENNPLFADVYAIRFTPFTVDRITTNKRVSSLGADTTYVAVAAADQDVDRLALVGGSGELEPVPSLGRPFAYNPSVVDGVMYYEDFTETPTGDLNRYFSINLATQKRTLLLKTREDLGGLSVGSDGQQVFAAGRPDKPDIITVRRPHGELRRFPVRYDGVGLEVGRRWIATTLTGADDRFGDRPETLLLLDPTAGTKVQVPGLQAICWTPDGTLLLARRTTTPTDSALVLLDPTKPKSPKELATVPGLIIYSGAWVRGAVPANGASSAP